MIFAANWKMKMSLAKARSFLEEFNDKIKDSQKKDFIFFPSAFLSFLFHGSDFSWGAQNVSYKEQAALTGENSASVLKEQGGSYCLVGHSERRQFLGETQKNIEQKIDLLQKLKLVPILCIGESQKTSKPGVVLKEQLQFLKNNSDLKKSNLILAYEPVWAIGTGDTPSSEYLSSVNSYIKDYLDSDVKILYGGSLNSQNILQYKDVQNLSGFLVGGSSLQAEEFYLMYNRWCS